jgi:hypothetical protein
MSQYWTYSQIRDKVERDLDLEGENFITPEEMLGYANEAVDEVERQIHNLCEDYFLTRGTITLIQGQEEYALPSDIYAMKVRAIVYRLGNSVWKVERIRDWHKFEQYEVHQTAQGDQIQYGFFVVNAVAGAPRILLAPTPNEAGSVLKIWYIRNANTLVNDSDVCDIPEAVNYIMQYMKVRCYEKEMSPNLAKAAADLEQEKQTTLATLSQQVVDNSNEIEADFRLYDDMN